ncbi:unnamed protein product [Fraxinus pennsylvanica]|uniref:Uncharacterized protein n=1 Tax=Fraxinus pennsylvanica TaxID=56036 RepID=A0AAD2AK32_9LAMI|nr:unnamed protein product [Fraxinus pennsylvanica]
MTAIEKMVSMDLLCSDKTATLPLNKFTVDKNLIKVIYRVFPKSVDTDTVVLIATRASQTQNQDAIDAAILRLLTDPKEVAFYLSRMFGFVMLKHHIQNNYFASHVPTWFKALHTVLDDLKDFIQFFVDFANSFAFVMLRATVRNQIIKKEGFMLGKPPFCTRRHQSPHVFAIVLVVHGDISVDQSASLLVPCQRASVHENECLLAGVVPACLRA